MSKKKEFAPTLQHQGEKQRKYNADCSACQVDCSTREENCQFAVLHVLQHGEENALHAAELTKMLHLSDTRSLRSVISRERLNGAPILSSVRGYFLPSLDYVQAEQELIRFNATMRRRAISEFTSAVPAKKALAINPEQSTLFDESDKQ